MRWLPLLMLVACRATSQSPSQASPDPTIAALAPPDGWTVVRSADRATFEDPEHALRVHVLTAAQRDAATAFAAAWLRVAPHMLTVPVQLDEPPPDGAWDTEARAAYELPVATKQAAQGVWRRFGDRGFVLLVEGDRGALARRTAQIDVLTGALRPADVRDEVLAGPVRALAAAELDAFVRDAAAQLEVPGAAIAVIAGGKVVYQITHGVRELGGNAPITPHTRFLLASVTKPMTTLMEAALVDAKVVRWDDPVTTLLPAFALGDAEITQQLVLWQMSCACTGMPRQDMEGLFEWADVTPEARLAVMKTMKPTTKIGETFQYSNPMVAAGGFIAAHAYAPALPLAAAYARAMQDKVFGPIGMTQTTLDAATVAAGEHALPHARAFDGTTRAMPLAIERAVEPIAPAGAVWTTLTDFIRYAQVELAEGALPDGTRVVSLPSYRERTRVRVRSDAAAGYGLGIDVSTYRGLRVVSHDGGAFGFGTRMLLFPDVGVGIVMLTNVRNGSPKEQLPFITAVTRRIVEELFPQARPLAARQLAYFAADHRQTRPAPPIDRAWLPAIAGHYHEPVLGELELRDSPHGPVLDAGEWSSVVARVVDGAGTATLVLLDPPFAGAPFVVGADTIEISDQVTYTFRRR